MVWLASLFLWGTPTQSLTSSLAPPLQLGQSGSWAILGPMATFGEYMLAYRTPFRMPLQNGVAQALLRMYLAFPFIASGVVMLSYFIVTAGIAYDMINEPPAVGGTQDPATGKLCLCLFLPRETCTHTGGADCALPYPVMQVL